MTFQFQNLNIVFSLFPYPQTCFLFASIKRDCNCFKDKFISKMNPLSSDFFRFLKFTFTHQQQVGAMLFTAISWVDPPPPPESQIPPPQKNTQNTKTLKMHRIYPPDIVFPSQNPESRINNWSEATTQGLAN